LRHFSFFLSFLENEEMVLASFGLSLHPCCVDGNEVSLLLMEENLTFIGVFVGANRNVKNKNTYRVAITVEMTEESVDVGARHFPQPIDAHDEPKPSSRW
jgi:hypothetical protein